MGEPTVATFEIKVEDGELLEAEFSIEPNPPLPTNPDPPEAA